LNTVGYGFSFNASSAFSSNFYPKLFFEPSFDIKSIGWLFPAEHTSRVIDYTMKTQYNKGKSCCRISAEK